MTTRKPPDEDFDLINAPEALPWYDALRQLLEPYEPAQDPKEADLFYSTHDIVQALEQHFLVPQGVIGKDIREPIDGTELVDQLTKLGFRSANLGGLTLQWLLKRKQAS